MAVFTQIQELNSQLKVVEHPQAKIKTLQRSDDPNVTTLPGNHFIELNTSAVPDYLHKTLFTSDLDRIAPHLWIIATQSSSSITPIHEQLVLGRTIVVTEDVHLYLLWYHDKVFLKPLPPYLLCAAFWDVHLIPPGPSAYSPLPVEHIAFHRAAAGLIRSYAHLVHSDIDFHLAVQHGLLPASAPPDSFARFIARFSGLPDNAVAPRFRFGEMRLSRLNSWAPILLHRMEYVDLTRQYEEYLARYFPVLLFVFGVIAVLLGAMQVALAVEALPDVQQGAWRVFVGVCKWTAIGVMVSVAAVVLGMLGLFLKKSMNEIVFAVRTLLRGEDG
ncbi:hypothetical protein C8F04DRAFT_1193258 [Mycena alexandri]|uniref:Uncharacterized protein n=1 Tax=Mycena alexandri TaxID=1745969 RepID=A0AAD6SBH1_9AGAR|nr:hypothetical protein C8F04DRAFT_1193258 [Mycena alexandri]